MKVKFIVVSILLLLIIGCRKKDFSISGKVYSNVTEKPVRDVDIVIEGESNWGKWGYTDSIGTFKFDSLKAGDYHLEIHASGYFAFDTIFSIKDQSITDIELRLSAPCDFHQSKALEDIENGEVKLLLVGSIAPVIYSDQHIFEAKYKVDYHDFGCTPPARDCIIQYNETIFNYLDELYSGEWRNEVRPDVVGF